MIRTVASTIALGLVLAGSGGLALAQQIAPPTTRTPSCTEGGCHAKEISYTFLHGPAAGGFCRACHDYKDESQHTFEFKRSSEEMCSFCHIMPDNVAGLHMHEPVADKQCIACHNPHGSSRRFLLQGPNNRAMCTTCHEPVLAGKSHVHTPIENNDCTQCHEPHSSLHNKLLREEPADLCKTCHAAIFEPILEAQAAALRASQQPGGEASFKGPFVHQPVQESCVRCHDTHASNYPKLLKDRPQVVCTSCHESIRHDFETAPVKHSPVMDGQGCLNCHDAHTSEHAHLMRDEPLKVCLACHSQNIPREDGTSVPSLAYLDDPQTHLHAPVAQGECRTCHNPHGAQNAFLLNEPFPRDFYHKFSKGDYALCFECHDSRLATEAKTTDATNFRNGDTNLHYVHVTKQGEAGRSCRVCHTVHGSAQARLTRETTPFGEWDIPIRFQPTDTGGSCAAGCHRPYRFDRVNPVDNLAEAPAPAPGPAPAPNAGGE